MRVGNQPVAPAGSVNGESSRTDLDGRAKEAERSRTRRRNFNDARECLILCFFPFLLILSLRQSARRSAYESELIALLGPRKVSYDRHGRVMGYTKARFHHPSGKALDRETKRRKRKSLPASAPAMDAINHSYRRNYARLDRALRNVEGARAPVIVLFGCEHRLY